MNTAPQQEASYRILFVCRHNAVRSQLAAALANSIGHGAVLAESAGISPEEVPTMVKTKLKSLGMHSSEIRSRPLSQMQHSHFDLIITLCDKSHQALPEHKEDREHIRWNFHHANSEDEIVHMEIELAERIRLLYLAKHLDIPQR